MKIYISGQITGLSIDEFTNNFRIAEYLAWKKLCPNSYPDIVNPLDISPLFGIKKWLFYMIPCVYKLRKCTHITMQSNWIHSKGAIIEYFIAKFILKLEIIWL